MTQRLSCPMEKKKSEMHSFSLVMWKKGFILETGNQEMREDMRVWLMSW